MATETLISVILPNFNGGAYLRESLDSIFAQTYTGFELIIVNDGSTDNSADIIASYNDRRIVLLRNEVNRGLVFSLNRALSVAKGSLIARIDSDDVCDPRRLEVQRRAFDSDPALLVAGTGYVTTGSVSNEPMDNDYLKALLLFSTCFNHSSVMMRNVFRGSPVRYDADFIHAEDYRLWTELAPKGRFGYIAEPLIMYRRHQGQVTAKYRAEQVEAGNRIRIDYLTRSGFEFDDAQLRIHQAMANNERLRSRADLVMCGGWLSELVRQNADKGIFREESFARLIHKYWIDTCGNSSVGIRAFFMALKSPLARMRPMNLAFRTRLLVKCLVRWR